MLRLRLRRGRFLAFRRRLALGGAQFHRLLAPDFFQTVVLADGRLHDVHDHVAQVDEDPFARVFAFQPDHVAACFLDLVAHRGGQRLRLAVRRARHDRDAVEQAGQVRRVEQDDFLALDVFEGVDDERLQFLDIH